MDFLLVEGPSDKCFFNALIRNLNAKGELRLLPSKELKDCLKKADEGPAVTNIEIRDCESNNPSAIEKELKAVLRQFKGNRNRVGIILDRDNSEIMHCLGIVNEALVRIFPNEFVPLAELGTPVTYLTEQEYEVSIAAHLIEVNERGELEDLLYSICDIGTPYKDCLSSWQNCLDDQRLSEKELNKTALQVLLRYDACTEEQRENAKENCTLSAVLERGLVNPANQVFNLNHPSLDPLKNFLTQHFN